MKVKRWYTIMLFAAACLAVNCAGKFLALGLQLPLWLDSFGTVLAAYVLGPVCGAMVGMTGNIIYSIVNSWDSMIYALVSAMVGISVGLCAKKGYLKSLFGALSVSFLVTVLSVLISVPLNFRFSGGYTQNIWGDGVIEAMRKIGFNNFFSCCMGQFYLDFLDKVITVLALYLAVKHYGIYKEKYRLKKFSSGQKNVSRLVIVFLMSSVLAGEVFAGGVSADDYTGEGASQDGGARTENYNDYLQTIYGRENGIPGGCANDIAQTNDGVLWFGTYGGLYRYNGSEFKWMDMSL